MSRAEMDATFARMKPWEKDLFLARLEELARKLLAQREQERIDVVAGELLAEVQL